MESGAMQLERRELTATGLIEAALTQTGPLATARKVTLTTKLEPDLPHLVADEAKLLRTLVNLLGNAIKFTPSGGAVIISALRSADETALQFCVRDTGEGIPAEAFERIFEKFGQVESQQGSRGVSTGLGLTFCKLAVEAHGGQIRVESTPGEGSTFCFEIPFLFSPE
jgi:signal transduction histidine kinase